MSKIQEEVLEWLQRRAESCRKRQSRRPMFLGPLREGLLGYLGLLKYLGLWGGEHVLLAQPCSMIIWGPDVGICALFSNSAQILYRVCQCLPPLVQLNSTATWHRHFNSRSAKRLSTSAVFAQSCCPGFEGLTMQLQIQVTILERSTFPAWHPWCMRWGRPVRQALYGGTMKQKPCHHKRKK